MRKLILGSLLPLAAMSCSRSQPAPPPATVAAAPATTAPTPVSVTSVALGKELGADKRISAPVEGFGAKDTIYASVETAGTGHAKLRALWSFVKGQKTAKVDETTIEMDSKGAAVNEFHLSKPSGWPKGDYKVEIFLNDGATAATTKTFKVS
jgi:hypothetical protein